LLRSRGGVGKVSSSSHKLGIYDAGEAWERRAPAAHCTARARVAAAAAATDSKSTLADAAVGVATVQL